MPFPTHVQRSIRRSRCLHLLLAIAGITASACGGEPPPDTLDRDSFVDAYVELRTAALLRSQPSLQGAVKDSVLRDIGVTEEELLTFADVHGGDLEFMRGVWADVSTRLDSVVYLPMGSPPTDSAGSR